MRQILPMFIAVILTACSTPQEPNPPQPPGPPAQPLQIELVDTRIPFGWTTPVRARLNGAPAENVNWSILEENGGRIETGNYFPPNRAGRYTIRASNSEGLVATASIDVAPDMPIDDLRSGGYVIYFRHTDADVGMDVGTEHDWHKSCDPAIARQLNEAGRQKARATGETIRRLQIPVGEVMSSEYCRTVQTAELMNLGPVVQTAVLTLGSGFNTGADFWHQLNILPRAGTNTVLVSHFAMPDAFSNHLAWGDAAVFRPNRTNLRSRGEFVGYIRASVWQATPQ